MADHLFDPNGEPPSPLQIEYYGPLYDEGKWAEFPSRYGWESSTEGKSSLSAIPQRYHSGVECWLYFGMLHYVFGRELNQSDFLLRDQEEYRSYITTKHLDKYIGTAKEWKKKKLGARTVEIVKLVCEQLCTPRTASCVRGEVGFLIRVACISLWEVTTRRDGPQPDDRYVRNCRAPGKWEYQRMLREGWCPLEVEKARMVGNVLTQAYLLQLPRPGLSPETHKACVKTECVANNIDESEYVTRHRHVGCDCAHVKMDLEALQTILQDGGVPLVKIEPDGEGNLNISIVRKRPGKRYVAISHVWSDGLGNTNGNSLPGCQLHLLHEHATLLLNDMEYVPQYEGVYGPLHTGTARLVHLAGRTMKMGNLDAVLIWIDTLCIPHQRDVRKLAIQRIREVYLDAYRTIILDSEMRRVTSKDATKLDILMRVMICSGWMRRLWTLQEGLAAKSRLYVLFSDRVVNISTIAEELLTKFDRGKVSVLHETVAELAIGTWCSFFLHTILHASKFERLVDVITKPFNINGSLPSVSKSNLISWNWFNVAMRATSKAEDRAIILAGVLDLDLGEILAAKGADDRMRKFYGMLNKFPQDIIFQDGLRFEEPGLRWAMKVCQYTGDIRYLGSGSGKIKPRGLEVTSYLSWLFQSNDVVDLRQQRSIPDQWIKETEDDSTHGPQNFIILLSTSVSLEFDSSAEHGLILEQKWEKEKAAPRVYGRQFDGIPTALVSVQTVEDPFHFARYESLANVSTLPDHTNLPSEGYLLRVLKDDLQTRSWVVG
ncbi:uncharacterized protein N7459_006811 [Penicillium hispanicum]|uniref:uncharacterized protein n=1 Tax=Penicillium hispanicum TaxID=1080232 RepID=UPI0025420CDD|nr:uncharacterized protein N7459_006811 [Penicillium hispanicum]KAJ5577847.1 hypothetical protein N7459_006811 [Penicillium hispanicum]